MTLLSPLEQRRERAVQMRSLGMTHKEIGEVLGVARSTIAAELDPDYRAKVRARRRRYGGVCVDCGRTTDGSAGRWKAPKRCRECREEYQRTVKKWTRPRIIAAIQVFYDLHGRPPRATEFSPALARSHTTPERWEEILRLHASGDWPQYTAVRREFGSWNNAIRAAGFKPSPPGRRKSE